MAKAKPKILIVDDDSFILDMYKTKFVQDGFQVETALSGKEAIQKIKEGEFRLNICLVDIVMPTMSGFDLVSRLTQDEQNRPQSIIMLTNLSQEQDIEKSKEMGADGYILKAEYSPAEVVDEVKRLTGIEL